MTKKRLLEPVSRRQYITFSVDEACKYLEWIAAGGTTADYVDRPGRPSNFAIKLWQKKYPSFRLLEKAARSHAKREGCLKPRKSRLRDAEGRYIANP